MEGSFEGARLREKQNAKMRFEIPQQQDKTLGAMFGFIEVSVRPRVVVSRMPCDRVLLFLNVDLFASVSIMQLKALVK